MINPAEPRHNLLSRLIDFLRFELADRPGRMAQTLQLCLCSLLVTVLSMGYGIPFLAISIALLYYGVQSNVFLTRFGCIIFVLATVTQDIFIILVFKYTYAYPLLRILFAMLIVCLSMYLIRVYKLGMIFFAVALIVGYCQTTADTLDSPEIALRMVLWAAVAVLYPVIVMWLFDIFFFPIRPRKLLQQTISQQLQAVILDLDNRLTQALSENNPADIRHLERNAVSLQSLHAFSALEDKDYRQAHDYWHACIATVAYMREAIDSLPAQSSALDASERSVLNSLKIQIEALISAVNLGQPYRCDWQLNPEEERAAQTLGVNGLCRSLQALGGMDLSQQTPLPKPSGGQFLPDSLTNPVYLRYALKTVLACMVCYVFYHGTDWDGIHTSLLTCIIVANPSCGASIQKMLLRCSGAFLGALYALVMAIFVTPHLDGIIGLLMILTPVLLMAGWIAAGSARSAYIGIQMIMTFGLSMLDHMGPVSDLTEIRDRAVGILVGILVSSVIYTKIWPESEACQMRTKLSTLMHQLGKLIDAATPQLNYLRQRLSCRAIFSQCLDMRDRIEMEISIPSPRRHQLLQRTDNTLQHVQSLLVDWDALQRNLPTTSQHWTAWQTQTAAAINQYAATLNTGHPLPTDPPEPPADADALQAVPLQRLTNSIATLPVWPEISRAVE